jgi:hypothetical protein
VEAGERDLPETIAKPHRSDLIATLETEARRQGKSFELRATADLISKPQGIRLRMRSEPADMVTASTGERESERYDALMARAGIAHAAYHYIEAAQLSERAAAVAGRDGLVQREALALSRLAYTLRRLNDFAAARQRATEALDRIGLADCSPERVINAAQLKARLTDDVTLEVYTTASRVLGHLAVDLEDIPTATTIFTNLEHIGEELGPGRLWANAELFLGRLLVMEGTTLDAYGAWKVCDRRKLEQGLWHIRRAKTLRHDGDEMWEAHRLYQETKAVLFLEGWSWRARRLMAQTEEAFVGSQAVANLLLTQGQFAYRADGKRTTIGGLFREALALGWEIHSDLLVANSLAALGELAAEVVDRSGWHWDQAVVYCLAGIGMWPSSHTARDFRRMVRLFNDLEVSPDKLRHLLLTQRPPLDTVSAVATFNDRLQKSLLGVRGGLYRDVLESVLSTPLAMSARLGPPARIHGSLV